MAISPPSDIVLDVARAVQPSAVETAKAELMKRAGATASGVSASFSVAEGGKIRAGAAVSAARGETPESFKKFEAMVLQTFVQNMLPKDGSAVYGKGIAGDMWKSLLAQQVSNAMAEGGGIGIADRMLGDHYRSREKTLNVGAVSGGPQSAATDTQASLSSALVQEMQRRITQSMTSDQATAGVETKL